MYSLFSKWWLLAGILAGLFIWGSWKQPRLSQYAPPTAFVVLNAPHLQSGADSAQLQARAMSLPGISACAIRPAAHMLVVAMNPDSLSRQELCQRLGVTVRPSPAPLPADPTIRQCPVPTGYVLAIEKVRFFFNLRRLFLHIA